MVNVTMNNERNGIEIRFSTKPEQEILNTLKANGFRWSVKQKMWYAKQTEERIQFANSISDTEIVEATALVDKETEFTDYVCEQVVSDEDVAAYRKDAEFLEYVSAMIIEKEDMMEKWNSERFEEYKGLMENCILDHNLNFNRYVIQQVKIPELKSALYELEKTINGIKSQFDKAMLKAGDKITIFKLGLGMSTIHGKYMSHEAQYENSVSMIYRPKNKKHNRRWSPYKDVIIYSGWVDIPEDLLWGIKTKNGITTAMSKYSSYDSKMYDVILDYFENNGVKPIINTYRR